VDVKRKENVDEKENKISYESFDLLCFN